MTTHQHEATRVNWDWLNNRVESSCSCGQQMWWKPVSSDARWSGRPADTLSGINDVAGLGISSTHQHLSSRVKWNWATDRIEHWCACGLKLSDEIDEASYGPPIDISVRGATIDAEECGQSWLIDLSVGLGVFALGFLVALTLLLLT